MFRETRPGRRAHVWRMNGIEEIVILETQKALPHCYIRMLFYDQGREKIQVRHAMQCITARVADVNPHIPTASGPRGWKLAKPKSDRRLLVLTHRRALAVIWKDTSIQ